MSTTAYATDDDDQIAVSAAFKRLAADGWTLDDFAAAWPSTPRDTIVHLLARKNPWRPFTGSMKAQYSTVLRRAQAHQNQRLLEVAEMQSVRARTPHDLVTDAPNVISLDDYRAKRSIPQV